MEPQKLALPAMTIVGIETRTCNADESDPKRAKIPALWQRFYGDNSPCAVAGRIGDTVFGVYSRYESDHNGAYSLLAGVEVAPIERVPAELHTVSIPAAEYFLFLADGAMPQAIIAAWGEVWRYFEDGRAQRRGYRRAFTCDFERYRAAHPDRAEIFISVCAQA